MQQQQNIMVQSMDRQLQPNSQFSFTQPMQNEHFTEEDDAVILHQQVNKRVRPHSHARNVPSVRISSGNFRSGGKVGGGLMKRTEHSKSNHRNSKTLNKTVTNSTAILTNNSTSAGGVGQQYMSSQDQQSSSGYGGARPMNVRLMSAQAAFQKPIQKSNVHDRISSAHMRRKLQYKSATSGGAATINSSWSMQQTESMFQAPHYQNKTFEFRNVPINENSNSTPQNDGVNTVTSQGFLFMDSTAPAAIRSSTNQSRNFKVGGLRTFDSNVTTPVLKSAQDSRYLTQKSRNSKKKRLMSAYGTNNRAPKEVPNLNFDLHVQPAAKSPKHGVSKPIENQFKQTGFETLTADKQDSQNNMINDSAAGHQQKYQTLQDHASRKKPSKLSFHIDTDQKVKVSLPVTLDTICKEFGSKTPSAMPQRDDTMPAELTRVYEDQRTSAYFGGTSMQSSVNQQPQVMTGLPSQKKSIQNVQQRRRLTSKQTDNYIKLSSLLQHGPTPIIRDSVNYGRKSCAVPKDQRHTSFLLPYTNNCESKKFPKTQSENKSFLTSYTEIQIISKSFHGSHISQSNMSLGGASSMVSGGFIAKRNAYLQRLSFIQPGQAIDALKNDIKKSVKIVKECNNDLLECQEYIVKTKVLIADVQEKTELARGDRRQLFRDLATFEFNFSKLNKREMFQRIAAMQEKIQVLLESFAQYFTFEGARGWITEVEVQKFMYMFDKIGILHEQGRARYKDQRSHWSFFDDFDDSKDKVKNLLHKAFSITRTPNRTPAETQSQHGKTGGHEEAKQITEQTQGSQEKSFTAQLIMSKLLNQKDECSTVMDISGKICFVKAKFVNNRIAGHVNFQNSSRQLNFDFEPLLQLKKKHNVYLEIKRLYLDYLIDEKLRNGKYNVQLCVQEQSDQPDNDYNLLETRKIFLAEIQGSPRKYTRVHLRKIKKVTSREEQQAIDEYKSRTGFPPPIKFDFVELTLYLLSDESSVQDQEITIEVALEKFNYLIQNKNDKFECISLTEVAKSIEKEIVLVQKVGHQDTYQIKQKRHLPGFQQQVDLEIVEVDDEQELFILSSQATEELEQNQKELVDDNNAGLGIQIQRIDTIADSLSIQSPGKTFRKGAVSDRVMSNEANLKGTGEYERETTYDKMDKQQKMAESLTEEQNEKFKKVFDQFDINKDGMISLREIKTVALQIGIKTSEENIEKMYHKIDINNDGEINFTEFLPLMNKFIKIDTNGEEHTEAYSRKKAAVVARQENQEVEKVNSQQSRSKKSLPSLEPKTLSNDPIIEAFDFFYIAKRMQNRPHDVQDILQNNSLLQHGASPAHQGRDNSSLMSGRKKHSQSGLKRTRTFNSSSLRGTASLAEYFHSKREDNLTNGKIQSLALKQIYVEIKLKYNMEDFSAFAQMRPNFRPEKNSALDVVFFKKPNEQSVKILVGVNDGSLEQQKLISEGTDYPNSPSKYNFVISFDNRLIHMINIKGIDTLDNLMDNVPLFCQCPKAKKIIWDEMKDPVAKKDRGVQFGSMMPSKHKTSPVVIVDKGLSSQTSQCVTEDIDSADCLNLDKEIKSIQDLDDVVEEFLMQSEIHTPVIRPTLNNQLSMPQEETHAFTPQTSIEGTFGDLNFKSEEKQSSYVQPLDKKLTLVKPLKSAIIFGPVLDKLAYDQNVILEESSYHGSDKNKK